MREKGGKGGGKKRSAPRLLPHPNADMKKKWKEKKRGKRNYRKKGGGQT